MKENELLEKVFRGMLENDVPLSEILTGLHNACVHGDVLDGYDMGKDDKFLDEFYKGLEISMNAVVDMEGD